MKCPFCKKTEIKVLESRDCDDNYAIRRRRQCLSCHERFTTYERVELNFSVIKKDGSKELFNEDKLKKGIILACEKRPIAVEQIESILSNIRLNLLSKSKTDITSVALGNLILDNLKSIDKIAYIRFASVYNQFDDVNSFIEAINKLE